MEFLPIIVILLVAAIVAVPLSRRLGFGSVLGYLAAGLVIGPAGLSLITNTENIQHVSEFGVVMLLFIIGLELRPQRLWTMRRAVFGLGSAQVLFCTAALAVAAHFAGLPWPAAILIAFALSLSSTAMVLPMLAERDLVTTQMGRDAFSILLFQDLAVIPAMALVPLTGGTLAEPAGESMWLMLGRGLAAIVVVLVGGRYLIRPLFRIVDGAKAPEMFTATALLIVVVTAALVSAAGLSMSLGAFMAGVLLSDSEYRHQVRADIEPFEGLLLGVFFISVGMSINTVLLVQNAGPVFAAVATLLVIKGALIFVFARLASHKSPEALRMGFALAQGGEFAFVLLLVALDNSVLTDNQAEFVRLVVTMSMMMTPILFWAEERFIAPRFAHNIGPPFDPISVRNKVIICGFGRVGQIVGRVLRLKGIPFTALDKNLEQIMTVRRFGSTAYFGDSSRLEMLRAAGAEEAKVLVIALEDVEESITVAEHAQRHFPHLKVLARARNRRHANLLMDRGVEHIVRETFYSSLKLTEMVLREEGLAEQEVQRVVHFFEVQDEKLLIEQHSYYNDEKQLIQTNKQVTEELRSLLEAELSSVTEENGTATTNN